MIFNMPPIKRIINDPKGVSDSRKIGELINRKIEITSWKKKGFAVVDIDPYGTASPFLDAAVACLHNGGLLCVTSTDMAVLCGSAPGTSMGKYGGTVYKEIGAHEQGLRLLLNAIQSAASRHGKAIEPLLSLSIDFYARVFVRLWVSPRAVKAIGAKHGLCFSCPGCYDYHIQRLGEIKSRAGGFDSARGPPVGPNCAICGSRHVISGPMWIGPLHNQSFLYSLLTELGEQPEKQETVELPFYEDRTFVDGRRDFSCQQCDKAFSSKHYLIIHERTIHEDPCYRTYSYGSELADQLANVPLSENLCASVGGDPASLELGTAKRIVGMCTLAYEELPRQVLYHRTDKLASVAGLKLPPILDLNSALLNAGYSVSSTHCESSAFKTDAPTKFLYDILMAHSSNNTENCELVSGDGENAKLSTDTRKRKAPDSPDASDYVYIGDHERKALIRSRPIDRSIKFDRHPAANPSSRAKGLVRFQVNPEKNWGPQSRPKTSKTEATP